MLKVVGIGMNFADLKSIPKVSAKIITLTPDNEKSRLSISSFLS